MLCDNKNKWLKALLLAVVAIGGCSEDAEPTLTSLWDNKFNSCYLNCHSPDGTEAAGPDLSSKQGFYDNLVGKTGANYPLWFRTSDCNLQFVNPGHAGDSSILATLLQSKFDALVARTDGTGCTAPYSSHMVSHVTLDNDPDIADALISWINDGAKNN